MSTLMIGIITLVALIVLLLIGVPVSATMGILGIAGMIFFSSPAATTMKMGMTAFQTMNSYNYTVVPLFSLMAMVICHTGVGATLYDFFYKLVGRFRGGLAIATILACGLFAAISSSSSATALTIGLIALPEMQKARYKQSISTGSIVAGGTLGPFIPPSSMMILYGIMAEVSITKLFLAGIMPGFVSIILFCIVIAILTKRNPDAAPAGPKFTGREIFASFTKCGEIIILIIIVLGGLFAGLFTPTEASAIGASGTIVITLIRKKLNWRKFINACMGALKNVGMIYAMIIGANLMNYFMTMSGVPKALAELLLSFNMAPKLIVVCMVVILMILGMFIDSMGMLYLSMPIFFPIIKSLGLDPVWFGVIMVACVEMAVVTPPVGLNLFVVKGIDPSVPMGTIYKGSYPFFIAQILCIGLIIFIPEIATFLPNLLG